jgi:hypothetical protein
MMRAIVVICMAAMMVIACNKKREKEEVVTEAAEQLCYIYFKNMDTVKMTIAIQDKNVSGELMYKLFEKDRNYGQLKGTLSGDTIIAAYAFASEDIKSVREVAFLKKGASLVEGFATMDSTGTRFSSHRDLTFSGIELQKTACPLL